MISEERKLQYWNYFTDEAQKGFRPKNITNLRLGQVRDIILKDSALWQNVMTPSGAADKMPEELMAASASNFQQTRSRFWTLVRRKIEQHQLTKSTRSS